MAVGDVVVALVVLGAAWADESVNEASPGAGALVMVEADHPVCKLPIHQHWLR